MSNSFYSIDSSSEQVEMRISLVYAPPQHIEMVVSSFAKNKQDKEAELRNKARFVLTYKALSSHTSYGVVALPPLAVYFDLPSKLSMQNISLAFPFSCLLDEPAVIKVCPTGTI